jgi:2-hydroxycyclohexanecarboxyl-CoA dehydrogenase
MDLQLNGKIALVTGAGQGVGRRIAHVLAAEGACVAVNDLFAERAEQVVAEIRASGGQARSYAIDITDQERVDAMVLAVKSELGGPIDILVNNAGVIPERREPNVASPLFVDSEASTWEKIINLNVYGTMYCCHAVLKDMRANRSGKIVSIISEAGRVGEAHLAVYSGAKAAILGFSKAIAREHGRDCINVNCVALGAVSHEGVKSGPLRKDATLDNEPSLKKMLGAYPLSRGLGRFAQPDDVADIVVFLASGRAPYITGQCIGASGGFTMI